MKNIANILTFSRIILATILLLFFHKISPAFIIIFIIAMLTDLFDGKIARKTGSCSRQGALLDTIADILLDLNHIKMVFSMRVMTKKLVVWLIVALTIGTISPIINFIKHKKVFFIHSITSKICMWVFFLVPFALYFGFAEAYITFTLILLTFAMSELVIMSILLKDPDPDAKSIYSIVRCNKCLST